jgi:hypothetical protein
MRPYSLALFVHVVGAITLVGASALLPVLVRVARRAPSVASLRTVVAVLQPMGRTIKIAAPLTLLAGLYMAFAANWWRMAWPFVALTAFAVAGVVSNRFEKATGAAWVQVATAPDGPVPAEVTTLLESRFVTLVSRHMIAVDVAIVFLMTAKPGLWLSLAAFAVTNAVAAATGRQRADVTAADALAAA